MLPTKKKLVEHLGCGNYNGVNFKNIEYPLFAALLAFAPLSGAALQNATDNAGKDLSIKVPVNDEATENLKNKLSGKKNAAAKKNSILDLYKGAMPQLQADEPIVYDEKTGVLTAQKNAKISDKEFELDADKIQYNQNTGYAHLEGDVRANTRFFRLASPSADMDVAKNAFSSEYLRIGTYPIYAESKDVKGNKKEVSAKESQVYFNEPAFASLSAKAKSFSYNAETDTLYMDDIDFYLGSLPFMNVSHFEQQHPRKPPFKVELDYGYNGDYGVYGRNTVIYTGSEIIHYGANFDFYTSRSVLFGPAGEYEYSGANTKITGSLNTGYIYDTGSKKDLGFDVLDRPIGANRYFIDWRHKQTVNDNIELTGYLNWWKDSETLRDFRPRLFYENQIPDNFVQATYFGETYSANLFTRFAPNDWVQTQQRLPEISFFRQPVQIGQTGINQTYYASAVHLREFSNSIYGRYIDSDRIDAYYGIDRPFALTSWSSFTPVMGGRLTYYNNTMTGDSNYVRMLGQIGFDADMNAWGTWEFKSDSLDIDGFRHNLRPILQYRYIPKASQGANRIPMIDKNVFSTMPSMLDLGLSRDVDNLYDTSTLRAGIENAFYTRASGYGSRKIASLNIFQDFNFKDQPTYVNSYGYTRKMRNYSDLFAGFDLYPAEWIQTGLYTRTDVKEGYFNQADYYIRLMDGDAFAIQLVTNYMEGQISQYWLDLEYKITQNYKVWGRWRYDSKLSKITEQVYALQTRVGNGWIVEYYIMLRSGATRSDGFSFGVNLELVTF